MSNDDLDSLGISRHQRSTLVRQGMLEPLRRGVYRTVGVGHTTKTRLVSACLAAGGRVGASHRAALWVWNLCEHEPPVEITVGVERHPLRRPLGNHAIVHRSIDLGFEVHGTKDALDYDLERQNLLVADGWQVLRYTRTHLRSPTRTAAQILQLATRRRAELAATSFPPSD